MEPATTYTALIARNVRAARAAADLSQDDVAARMQSLGFREWRRQTVGNTERGKRRLTCEEALGLTISLETSLEAVLQQPKEREWQDILLPGGNRLTVSILDGQRQAGWAVITHGDHGA